MKMTIKNALLLTMITLIAGVLLGGVYKITKEPIAEQKEKEAQEACKAVFEDADSFDMSYEMEADESLKAVEQVIPALDADGKTIGYVLNVTSNEGYGGDISFMLGIQADGTVNGISILSISETAGLGMRATEPEFYEQFSGKQVEQFAYTKSGAQADNEIDALSGATITTNAITNGVNAGLSYFQNYLKEGA